MASWTAAGDEMSVIIAGDSKIKRHFVSWIAGECRTVSRKRNRLALSESFLLKAGGCKCCEQKRSICSLSMDLALWRSVITEDCFDLGRGVDSSDSESDSSFSVVVVVLKATSSVA